jgi:hypothetical protein
MITPDFFMSLIVDGMDQNTTMVPKMRQIVKNIESRFVKTHLYGVLVHNIGLYADVWIDAHKAVFVKLRHFKVSFLNLV